MSPEIPNSKELVNTIYHASILSALTVGYSMIAKKFIKFDVGDPSRDYETVFKLVIPVAIAVVTRDWMVSQGFLPNDIMNK